MAALSATGTEGHFDALNPFGTDKAAEESALNKDGSKDFDVLAKFQEHRKTYFSFAAGCMDNISVDVFGKTVTIDLSVFCSLGDIIRFLMHLTGYMFAVRIFHRTLT